MIRYFWAAIAAVVTVIMAPVAMAQCAWVDGKFQCSGNSEDFFISGTPSGETFKFLDGTSGSIVVHSGGGPDVIDFSDFTGPVRVDVSTGTPVLVAPGLQISFFGFDGAPGVTIKGGAGDDVLVGGAGDDVLIGGPGADDLRGNGGNDRRGDIILADCSGDTLNSIETDSCAAPAPVPTLSEWATILLSVLLAGGAALAIHRRQTTA